MKTPLEKAKERPTETAAPLAWFVAALACKALDVEDADTVLYLAGALSFVPAVVTWVVNLARR